MIRMGGHGRSIVSWLVRLKLVEGVAPDLESTPHSEVRRQSAMIVRRNWWWNGSLPLLWASATMRYPRWSSVSGGMVQDRDGVGTAHKAYAQDC